MNRGPQPLREHDERKFSLMKTSTLLGKYLILKYPESKRDLLHVDNYYDNSKCFHSFLKETIVVKREKEAVKLLPESAFRFVSYFDAVDRIIEFLVKERINNVLVQGYQDSSLHSSWGSKMFCPFSSFRANILKSNTWHRLYNSIGAMKFQHLLLEVECFVKLADGNLGQLFGELNKSPIMSNELSIRNRSHGFHGHFMKDESTIFSGDALNIIMEMLPNEESKIRSAAFPKRLRKLRSLCQVILDRDRKCKYRSIFLTICFPSTRNDSTSIFNYSTSSLNVIRFVILIIEKLFPLLTWGTKKNKNLVLKKIAYYIEHSYDLSGCNMLSDIAIKDINWLGKQKKISSVQDFQSRSYLLNAFMRWLFDVFLFKLIGCFWFRNGSPKKSHGERILHFPQEDWKFLFNSWFRNYKKEYLIENKCSRPSDGVAQHSRNIGKLKLIPKKLGFRALCIPLNNEYVEQRHSYARKLLSNRQFLNNSLKPVREIIAYEQKMKNPIGTSYPKCYSLDDIAGNIIRFKASLLRRCMHLPKLFAVRFDIENCFDNLSQLQILDSMKGLFEDRPDDIYYVRRLSDSPVTKREAKRFRYIVKKLSHVEEFDIFRSEISNSSSSQDRVLNDGTLTFRISKSDVFDVVKDHIFNITLVVPGIPSTFIRKKGIFQGFPLLSILCDVTLDYMVAKEFEFLKTDTDSLLLRVADDFLFLTTSHSRHIEVLDSIRGERLKRFGVSVNPHKTSIMTHESRSLDFLGISLHLRSLSITKTNDSSSVLSFRNLRTFKAAFSYLSLYCKARIKTYLISLKLNTLSNIFLNIGEIIIMIMRSFYKQFKNLSKNELYDENELLVFIHSLIATIKREFKKLNGSQSLALEKHMRRIICTILLKHRRFEKIIPRVKYITKSHQVSS